MSEQKDRVYPPAMNWSEPMKESPDFVKAKVGIVVEEFIEFLQANVKPTGWINFEMKVSREGNYYWELDQWEPKAKEDKPSRHEEEAPF